MSNVRLTPKPSVTGLMTFQHETKRVDNLFFKKKGSAYYLPEFGIDWDLWNSPRVEYSIDSFSANFTQEATRQGIVVVDVVSDIADFSLNVRVQLLSENVTLNGGKL
jgi:hypothetical protein